MFHLSFPGGFKDKLAGKPCGISAIKPFFPETVAVNALDLKGLKPRLKVAVGDHVAAGQTIFVSKSDERIRVTAPCSGEISQILRGDRRVLIDVVIKTDKNQTPANFSVPDLMDMNRENLQALLLEAGFWPFIRQYPFDIVANPDLKPKAIFVRAGYTEPHSPDLNSVIQEKQQQLISGLTFLQHFTSGNIWLIRTGNDGNKAENPFRSLRHVNVVNAPDKFPADHPGLVSYNLSPLRKDECFWYLDLQDLLEMVHLLETGSYNPYRLISVAGTALQSPEMLWVHRGIQIKDAIRMKTALADVRFISGGIFTGRQLAYDGYLGFYANSIQVLPEGRQRLFLRWLQPGHAFHSCSRNFLSAFIPVREFSFNTGVFGEERACVQCGACERICPLGLMPNFIYKAVLAEDYDMVEDLGIRDCINCGLCTYSCPSKIQLNNTFTTMLQTLKKEEE